MAATTYFVLMKTVIAYKSKINVDNLKYGNIILDQLIFVMVKCSVLFEVRTEFLNII
jgi:hypothetical protein